MRQAIGVALGICAVVMRGEAQVPTRLSLDEALELARERNPAYRRALAQADATGADIAAGVGAILPNLTGNLNFSGSSNTVVTGTDDFGKPIELTDPLTFRNSAASQGLSTNITLFDGLQNLHNLQGARAGANAAHAAADAEAASLEGEVKRWFYQALRYRELIVLEETLLDARRTQLAATERLFRVAAQTQVDVLGAQVDVSRQEQALETARGEAQKAVLALAEQIGLPGDVTFDVDGEFPLVFDPGALDLESLLQQVKRDSPVLRQYEARANQAEFSTRAARGRRWPTITASLSFGRSLRLDGYDALLEFNPQDRAWNVGFGMQVPLFSRFSTSQAVAQAVATERAAEENLREVDLQLERQLRTAVIDLQNAYHQQQLAERSAELGRERLRMAREQYLVGSRSFAELQQIVSTTASDERQALAARLDYANALVSLEELVGRPVQP